MKSGKSSIIIGIVLVLIGVLMLLDALGLASGAALIWTVIFAAGGAAFLHAFLQNRDEWWAAIPAGVLIGLAFVTAWNQLMPASAERWSGSLFLLCMGSGFIAVYWREHRNWWALIPGGVMWTLAIVSALPPATDGMISASVLFLGLAATFASLALLPTGVVIEAAPGEVVPGSAGQAAPGGQEPMKWPLIPAAVLAVFGLLFAIQASTLINIANFAVPVALVLAGLYLMFHAFRVRSQGHGVHRHG